MSMSKVLSIIVPSYNMEKLLSKCLGSLVIAPELMDRLEVLVVNDGSKDQTSEIAHGFAAKWPGTFRVIDKENGNYGSCINAALPMVTGKYVKLLDADDWYDTENFKCFLSILDGVNDAELIVTDYDRVNDDDAIIWHREFDLDQRRVFGVERFLERVYPVPSPACTYRREVFLGLGYRQLEGVSYTDWEWTFLPLLRVRCVRYFPLCVYKYFCGRDGQTMNANMVAQNWWMLGEIALDLLDQFQRMTNGSSTEVGKFLGARIGEMLEGIYRTGLVRVCTHEADEYMRRYDRRLKELSNVIYERFADVGYSRFVPYRFIRAWRSGNRIASLMLTFCKASSAVGRLMRKIRILF